ncbi:MAG: helix-turn-helix domain-containing protein [Holdemanella sp.]|uniref:helix-turn-helix domain-containing protein n=1 Tax=Holdemanella sp. TaxID=1971762 RepID=UPI0039966444
MSPAAFLRAQKMHAAAELLRSTDRTVLDIAGQFGYDNASKFARAFRSVIGVSPNAYRSGATADSCAPVRSEFQHKNNILEPRSLILERMRHR